MIQDRCDGRYVRVACLVEDIGQPFITSGWVIVRKEKEGIEI